MEATNRTMKIIAHRGASGYAPENTLAAFAKALELGADMVEMDIHLSKDGEIMVIHDDTLERTTNGRGHVCDYTVADLKELDASHHFSAYRGERLPTLPEVIELVNRRAGLVIEIKNGPVFYPGIEAKLVRLLEQYDLVTQTIVIAFYHPSLQIVKQLNPAIQTGILYAAGLLEPWTIAAAVGAQALHPCYEYTTPEMIVEAQRRGYRVHPWTIDQPADLERWAASGVDAITTDFPDRLARILACGGVRTASQMA